MYTITRKKIKLYHEIFFNEKTMSFIISLCPEANNFIFKILGEINRMTDWLREQKEYSPFIFPNEEAWGHDGGLKRSKHKPTERGWISWECQLPKKSKQKNLNDISGNLYQLVTLLQLFSYENAKVGSSEKAQFLIIDGIMPKTDKYFHGGAFSFSYARPVLDFCAKIWENDNSVLYDAIMNAMQKTYLRLTGRKTLQSFDKYSFRIGNSQGDGRLISMGCPGNCA